MSFKSAVFGGPRVSVIIPTYGRAEMLDGLLGSIRKSAPREAIELVVVSSDLQDSQKVRRLLSQDDLTVIFAGQRKGRQLRRQSLYSFTNLGIKRSTFEWVFVVNDDMTFDEDWYSQFSKIVSDPRNNNVGMVIVASHIGSIDLGIRVAKVGRAKVRGNWEDVWLSDLSLIRRDVLESIGFFDEQLQWYGSGVDNSLKVRFLTQSEIYVAEQIRIHHHIAQENRNPHTESSYLDFRYLQQKWNSWCANNGCEYQIDFGYNINSLFQALKYRLIRLVGRVHSCIERK